MTEDNLQWLTLAFMFLWLLMISRWVSETTTLLKSWWNDHLRDMIKDRWKGGRVKPTEPWPDPPGWKRGARKTGDLRNGKEPPWIKKDD